MRPHFREQRPTDLRLSADALGNPVRTPSAPLSAGSNAYVNAWAARGARKGDFGSTKARKGGRKGGEGELLAVLDALWAAAGRARRIGSLAFADSLLGRWGGGGVFDEARAKNGWKSPFSPLRGPASAILSWVLGSALSPRPPGAPKSYGHAARHAPRPPTTALALRAQQRPRFPRLYALFHGFSVLCAVLYGEIPTPVQTTCGEPPRTGPRPLQFFGSAQPGVSPAY